jgi:hypothetical protein
VRLLGLSAADFAEVVKDIAAELGTAGAPRMVIVH